MPTTISTFMFHDPDQWRTQSCARTVSVYAPDSGCKLSYIQVENDMYPLALKTAFDFVSRNHNGRYRDRTLMTIRRWAERVQSTTPTGRLSEMYSDPDRRFPIILIAEIPFSYDEDSESKNGGVVGINLGIDDGDGGYRGVLCTSKNYRQRNIASALVASMGNVSAPGHIDYYANNKNFNAARLAAKLSYTPISINSESGVVQYRMTEV